MANQIVVSAGAKVRNLDGVLTGTSGVVNSLPINASNGIPQLDVNGKILVSQLPNSVMEYQGTWNVATNTPYLVNGVGNQGDVYLVEGAATTGTSHDFGAGAITFYNGDQAIYSGSIWQRASGATGTVTSVAITESGDSLNITGSPITTSGTINIGFNGTNLQYVNGAGNLTTFPTLMTSVGLTMPSAFTVTNSPLTGAGGTLAVTGAGTTAQYIRGDGSLATFPTIATEAQRLITEVYNETGATLSKGTVVYINGGHGNLPTITKALATGDATSAQTYGIVQTDITNMNNGYVVVIGSLTDLDTSAYVEGTQLYLSSTTAGAWTSVKQYAPAHLVYVAIVTRSHPTQGVVEVMIQNGFEMDELHNVSAQSPLNNQGLFYNTSTSLWENKSIATALGYTPANDASVVHLTGNETIAGAKTFSSDLTVNGIKVGIGGGSGANNTRLGSDTLSSLTTASNNIAVGANALFSVTSGNANVGIGGNALYALTTGTINTAIGFTAGSSITTGSYNTIVGKYVGTATLDSNVVLADGIGNIRFQWDGTNILLNGNIVGSNAYTSTAYLPLSGGTLTGTLIGTTALFNGSVDVLNGQINLSNSYYLTARNNANNTFLRLIGRNSSDKVVIDTDGYGTILGGALSGTSATFSSSVQTGSDLTVLGGINMTRGANTWIGTTDNFALTFMTNGVGNRMVISNTGNVGIGTSSPNYPLEVRRSTGMWSTSDDTFGAVMGVYYNTGNVGSNQNRFRILADQNAVYFDGYDAFPLVFRNNGNTERMRITSGGNVLIGTTTDNGNGNLQIANSSSNKISLTGGSSQNGMRWEAVDTANTFYLFNGAYGTAGWGLYNVTNATLPLWIQNSGAATFSSSVQAQTLNILAGTSAAFSFAVDQQSTLAFGSTNGKRVGVIRDSTAADNGLQFGYDTTDKTGIIAGAATSAGCGIDFYTYDGSSWANRMRVTKGGNVLIGTTSIVNSNSGLLQVLGTTTGVGIYSAIPNGANGSANFQSNSVSTASTSWYHWVGQSGNGSSITTNNIIVYGNGNIQNTNNSYGSLSDISIKENIKDASNKLEDLLKVKIRNYNLIGDNQKQIGVIAQELEEIFPSMIEIGIDKLKGVKYSVFVPILIKALQEQQVQIQELKQLINK